MQGQHHVLAHRGRGDDAGALAILRAETKTIGGRLARRADGHRLAPHPTLAAIPWHYAEHQLGGFGATRPEQAGETHYLPWHDVETERGDDPALAIVSERHRGLIAAQRLAGPLEGVVVQLAPQHHLDQIQLRQRGGIAGTDQLAVAKHSDAIADGVDLIEKMGDEDEAHPLVPQVPHQGEQHLHLAGIQTRSGFIEDQDPGGQGDGPGDGHYLLHGDRMVAQGQGDIHLEAVSCHDGLGLPVHGGSIDEAEAAGFVADEEVVGHRHVRQQIDLLIDGAYPQALGMGGICRGDGDTIEFDTAPVGLIDAGEGLDQGGFAGTVLAEQRHDLSPT
ncbi:hypothetical protein D3C72_434010 [compost metagenome]